jgi:hypothetical protein
MCNFTLEDKPDKRLGQKHNQYTGVALMRVAVGF